MKKWLNRIAALIGALALIWLVSTIANFGAYNMRRVEQAAAHWRFTGQFR